MDWCASDTSSRSPSRGRIHCGGWSCCHKRCTFLFDCCWCTSNSNRQKRMMNTTDRLRKHFQTTEFTSWGCTLAYAGLLPEEEYGLAQSISPPYDQLTVLDLGTGGGRIAIDLAKRGFGQVQGFDYVPEFIEQARTNADSRFPNLSFDLGDVRSLPVASS